MNQKYAMIFSPIDAAAAQVLAEKGGVGKIVLLTRDPQN
jgi:hypothetical protein